MCVTIMLSLASDNNNSGTAVDSGAANGAGDDDAAANKGVVGQSLCGLLKVPDDVAVSAHLLPPNAIAAIKIHREHHLRPFNFHREDGKTFYNYKVLGYDKDIISRRELFGYTRLGLDNGLDNE